MPPAMIPMNSNKNLSLDIEGSNLTMICKIESWVDKGKPEIYKG